LSHRCDWWICSILVLTIIVLITLVLKWRQLVLFATRIFVQVLLGKLGRTALAKAKAAKATLPPIVVEHPAAADQHNDDQRKDDPANPAKAVAGTTVSELHDLHCSTLGSSFSKSRHSNAEVAHVQAAVAAVTARLHDAHALSLLDVVFMPDLGWAKLSSWAGICDGQQVQLWGACHVAVQPLTNLGNHA